MLVLEHKTDVRFECRTDACRLMAIGKRNDAQAQQDVRAARACGMDVDMGTYVVVGVRMGTSRKGAVSQSSLKGGTRVCAA